MPVYNAELFLKESIQSILNQTETNFELVIVNDGSTDQSEKIIASFTDPRIHYFKQKNQGDASARNLGLSKASGEFIAWQDADDISLPHRLKALKEQFSDPKIGYVHSDALRISDKNQPIMYDFQCNISQNRLLRELVRTGSPFRNPSMMARKEVYNGLQFDTSLIIGSDTDILRFFILNWKGVHVPEPLMLYRRHPKSMMHIYRNENDRFAHLKKLIESTPIQTLIPEAFVSNVSKEQSLAIAYAILYYFMVRRLAPKPESQKLLEQACTYGKENEVGAFIYGIEALSAGQFKQALECFSKLPLNFPKHISLNYKGEVYLFLDRPLEAYPCFIEALNTYPEYDEPIYNLKLVGGSSFRRGAGPA